MSTIKVTNLRHEDATSDNISLTDTNRVGIGTSSPAVVVEAQAAQAELQLKSTSGTNSAGLRFVPGGETNALYIYADGSRNINIDNHATSIASFRAGGGLTFNGDTSTDNALDDYEEGTWTPSVGGTATYTNQNGKYTKIGNTVFIEGHLQISSIGTGSTTTMSGLPFTAGSTVEGGLHVTYFNGLAVDVISTVLGVNSNSTNTTAYSRTTGGTASSSVAIYGDSARIYFYGHYFV